MAGSLKTISQGLSFEPDKLNLGIGSTFISNSRLAVINNNQSSWKTAIFKNDPSSDYLTIGSYNNNIHISAIANDNSTFKDLYINNLGIVEQPSNQIGNIIINGKTTIGNSFNSIIYDHTIDIVSKNSNIAIFRNNNYILSISANQSGVIINSSNNSTNKLGDIFINSNLNVSGIINGSNYLSNLINPSLYTIPANWIKIKSNTGLITNNSNELELAIDTTRGLDINNGKLVCTVLNSQSTGIGIGTNPSFSNVYINDLLSINSNNYQSLMNEKLFVNGSVAIGSCNNINPLLNFNKNNYGLFVSSNVFFNSNLNIGGTFNGNGSNITNIRLVNIINPTSTTIPANWINIKSNDAIKTNENNQLYLDFDNTDNKLYLNASGKLSLNIGAITGAIPLAINLWQSNNPSEIYFRNGDSFVGIGNTNPKSSFWVGNNGNLLRLTAPNSLNTSYFSQIATNDNENNNTKIKLITPTNLTGISGADVSLSSGSIYYIIAGDNPSHNFIYDNNGINSNLININKFGNVGIGVTANLINKLEVNGKIKGSNLEISNKTTMGSVLTSFDGYPLMTEYPLNVYGNIGITGNIFTTSDKNLKTNIKTIENSLDKIIKCRGVSFNYSNNDKNQFGVIAQEIEEIIPDIVETNENGIKNVNYLSIIGFLIEAIKELNNKI